jgi:hypothetical protein
LLEVDFRKDIEALKTCFQIFEMNPKLTGMSSLFILVVALNRSETIGGTKTKEHTSAKEDKLTSISLNESLAAQHHFVIEQPDFDLNSTRTKRGFVYVPDRGNLINSF